MRPPVPCCARPHSTASSRCPKPCRWRSTQRRSAGARVKSSRIAAATWCCGSRTTRRLEADRAVFNVDIVDPCWVWRDVDLTRGASLTTAVGQVPFNFQIGRDVDAIRRGDARTADGELEIRTGDCAGEPVARLPLAEAAGVRRRHGRSGRSASRRKPAAATCACASRGRGSTRSGPSHGWRSESEPMSDIVLLTPLPGWAMPLEEVDDEVFAGRMLGDGIAVDPTDGTLRAPCDGEVTALPESAHAVSLRAAGGAELLLHVGIDTVALKGEGFEALVRVGQHVSAGDPLLRFDLDRIARGARSLVTPVIVTTPERYRIVERSSGRLLRAGDALMTLREVTAAADSSAPTGGAATGSLRVALPHGLHARPAAFLAQAMRPLRAEATLSLRGRTADVRSAVSLLSLGARHGDALALRATRCRCRARAGRARACAGASRLGDRAAAGRSEGRLRAPAFAGRPRDRLARHRRRAAGAHRARCARDIRARRRRGRRNEAPRRGACAARRSPPPARCRRRRRSRGDPGRAPRVPRRPRAPGVRLPARRRGPQRGVRVARGLGRGVARTRLGGRRAHRGSRGRPA